LKNVVFVQGWHGYPYRDYSFPVLQRDFLWGGVGNEFKYQLVS
jgi:hypothetical protein